MESEDTKFHNKQLQAADKSGCNETNSIMKLPMCKKKEKYSSRGSTIKKQTTIVAEW